MNKALRLFLVDDELPALMRLQDLLADCAEECPHTIVGTATNGMTALPQIAEHEIDVVILDIQMPQMSGIEVARKLLNLSRPPAVIFATAFEDYGVAAFDVRAIDYLLKPIRHERLVTALRRAQELHHGQNTSSNANHEHDGARTHFSVSERGRVHLIPVAEARFLKAEQKYITLRTHDREYLLEDSLTKLEDEFGSKFVRIHRNCLVSRDSIAGFERAMINGGDSHWVVILRDVPERLPVSRRQQHVIKEFKKGHDG
ncbi:response regulator transcription factor [Chitinibacter bivalviorum]|uniref:Response regulator transcription factor n=1 Tax=Chitinibacter bivalviorum TaxID=2739434 RepID=A0A7H9BLK4_9NEIS|nr:LytTR family DNA-binding domain-containing protein [Chitinibacter bivalviorum]QLG89168.1 response regulator transcription factor [Chitinibacter bivalviorum]